MNYQQWFKENQKYIHGADVDAWCETAFEAGGKAHRKLITQMLEALEWSLPREGAAITYDDAIKDAKEYLTAPEQSEPKCNPHPKAPHGFNRNSSHSAGQYVCDCEGWDAWEAGYSEGMEAGVKIGDYMDSSNKLQDAMTPQPKAPEPLTDEEIYAAIYPLYADASAARFALEVSIDEYRAVLAAQRSKE